MSRPKLNEEQIAKLQGQIAVTKDGKRYIFNSAKEALEYIKKNTPEGYNVYDTTSYARNYDPKINERYSSKEQKDKKMQKESLIRRFPQIKLSLMELLN